MYRLPCEMAHVTSQTSRVHLLSTCTRDALVQHMLLSACWPPGALTPPGSNLNTTAEQFVLNFPPLFQILQKACLVQKKPKGSLASADCPQALKQGPRTVAHGPQPYCTAHTTRKKFYIFKQWKKLKKQNILRCEGIL